MVYKKALNLSVTFLLIFILTGCSSTRKNVEQILFGGGNNNEAEIIRKKIWNKWIYGIPKNLQKNLEQTIEN